MTFIVEPYLLISEIIQKFAIIADESFIPDINREIISDHKWTNAGIKSLIQFAWALTLRALSQYPNVQSTLNASYAVPNSFCVRAVPVK